MAQTASNPDFPPALSAYGIGALWQVPFLLPLRYRDLRSPIRHFGPGHLVDGTDAVVAGVVSSWRVVKFPAPRLEGRLVDEEGLTLGFSVWGETRALQEHLKGCEGSEVVFAGVIEELRDGRLWLSQAWVVSAGRLGLLEAIYPASNRSKRGVNAEFCRALVQEQLHAAVPLAAQELERRLTDAGGAGALLARLQAPWSSVTEMLLAAHSPRTPDEGWLALDTVQRMAAMAAILKSRASHKAVARRALAVPPAEAAFARIPAPFVLTADQIRAIHEIREDLLKPVAMRRVLFGGVGTGKSFVIASAAYLVASAGGRTAILLPNVVLVEQMFQTLCDICSGLAIPIYRASSPGSDRDLGSPGAAPRLGGIYVGTTALLHRQFGRFDLVVTDEQHRFSRAQREQLLAGEAHALESTATSIPRTQALIEFGIMQSSHLRSAPVQKRWETRIWNEHERGALFQAVRGTVALGGQVMVLYPKRAAEHGRDAVQAGAALWEKAFPGRVQTVHGGRSDVDNLKAVGAMRRGAADILVCTTVVEVGLDLPRLMRVVVVRPDCFGLATLHQIRGRTARQGGTGYCDLFLQKKVSDGSMARLRVLVETTDDVAISKADLAQRGAGDIQADSDTQSGADERLIFGQGIGIETYEAAVKLLDKETRG